MKKERKKLAYICSPYRGAGRSVEENIKFAQYCARQVKKCGYLPFIPHTHISILSLSHNEVEALEICRGYISICDILLVCGKKFPMRMREEIYFAEQEGVEIYKLEENGKIIRR